jgi:polysaccharide export outer membrane protein
MAYITDAERDSAQRIIATYANSIHPGDQLYIYVHSQIPESVIPFNQETHNIAVEMNHINMVGGNVGENVMAETYQPRAEWIVSGYLVDDHGLIDFPVLGKIHVAGLSYDSLQAVIQQRLINDGYLLDPVVTVSSMNFRVSVVGEVAQPRELHVQGDRLTLLEALAMCGDITVYGQRENVVVMREKNGEAVPIVVDLTKKTLFDSEAYYLQHNDIVYIEPDKHRKRSATLDENWPKYLAFGVSLAAAVVNITRANVALWNHWASGAL